MPRKREQGSARKAVTLLSFRFHSLVSFIHIYPAICRAVRTPPQNSAKAKEVRSGSGCRKSPHFISREIISLCFVITPIEKPLMTFIFHLIISYASQAMQIEEHGFI